MSKVHDFPYIEIPIEYFRIPITNMPVDEWDNNLDAAVKRYCQIDISAPADKYIFRFITLPTDEGQLDYRVSEIFFHGSDRTDLAHNPKGAVYCDCVKLQDTFDAFKRFRMYELYDTIDPTPNGLLVFNSATIELCRKCIKFHITYGNTTKSLNMIIGIK